MVIYLQKEGVMPVYTEAKAQQLEKQGWKRVDIAKIRKAKIRKMAKDAADKAKKLSDNLEKELNDG